MLRIVGLKYPKNAKKKIIFDSWNSIISSETIL